MKYEKINIIDQVSCQISNVVFGKDLNLDSFYCVWTQWKKKCSIYFHGLIAKLLFKI